MCGICGVFDLSDASPDRRAVKRMTTAMEHRGPDSEGFIHEGPASLGIRRLAIIDLSSGDQPLYNEDSTCAVILNGAIYNFKEIREELSRLGHRFSSQGDTEVIVHAYEEWGPESVKKLRGMFSFAVCDWRREQPRIFLARDRLGVKPLYFHSDPERFIFASEVRSILASGLVARKLSDEGLQTYLAYGSVQEPLTLVEGIESVPPGHSVTVDRSGVRIDKYWSMPVETRPGDSISTHALRTKLLEATQLRLVSDVPLGVFLSGGIDSGAITGLMATLSPEPVRAITVSFKEDAYDESALAAATAARAGVWHDQLLVTEDDVLADLPDAIAGMDQPTIDGINTWYVSRETKRSGVTVALSGVGGDELFAGYDIFPRLLRLGRWTPGLRKMPRPVRQAAARALDRAGRIRWDKVAALLRDDVPFDEPYFLVRGWLGTDDQRRLLKGSWRPESETDRWGPRAREELRLANGLDAIGRISALDMRHYMLSRLLRDTDSMAMANSLEVRTPFLDHELVEEVLPQSGARKFTGKSSKPMLVDAVKDLLPPEVTQAPKRGFNFPWDDWLRGRLKATVESVLNGESAITTHLDPSATKAVWEDFQNRRTSWSRPWGLYVLDKWIGAHLS